MKEQEFNYNPIMYPMSVLGLVTGNILGDRTDYDWLPWLLYGVAILLLIIALLKHRTIIITENEIRIKELLKGQRTILKSEVLHYHTTMHYRKTPFTTWYFTMKNGNEIMLAHDYMQKEKELTEAVNEWCNPLTMETSA